MAEYKGRCQMLISPTHEVRATEYQWVTIAKGLAIISIVAFHFGMSVSITGIGVITLGSVLLSSARSRLGVAQVRQCLVALGGASYAIFLTHWGFVKPVSHAFRHRCFGIVAAVAVIVLVAFFFTRVDAMLQRMIDQLLLGPLARHRGMRKDNIAISDKKIDPCDKVTTSC